MGEDQPVGRGNDLFLRSWLKSESGQHLNADPIIEWREELNLGLVMPHIKKSEIDMVKSDAFMSAVMTEFYKRNNK